MKDNIDAPLYRLINDGRSYFTRLQYVRIDLIVFCFPPRSLLVQPSSAGVSPIQSRHREAVHVLW